MKKISFVISLMLFCTVFTSCLLKNMLYPEFGFTNSTDESNLYFAVSDDDISVLGSDFKNVKSTQTCLSYYGEYQHDMLLSNTSSISLNSFDTVNKWIYVYRCDDIQNPEAERIVICKEYIYLDSFLRYYLEKIDDTYCISYICNH